MLEKYRSTLHDLTGAERSLLAQQLEARQLVDGGRQVARDPDALFMACERARLCQADLVCVLAPHISTVARSAIEKLVGHPIRVLPPQQIVDPMRATLRAQLEAAKNDDPREIVRIKPNPKRPGSAAHARYNLYREGMTVSEYLRAGGRKADLRWDIKKRHIVVRKPRRK